MTDIEESILKSVQLLDSIARLSYSKPYKAMDILQKVEVPTEMSFLRCAVFELVARHMLAVNEFDVQKHFWENLSSYLPGSERVKKASNGKDMPDGWVSFNGSLLPVEVKKNEFTRSGVEQLVRYMKAYGCKKGVAVGRSFQSGNISNIICIEHKFFETLL